MPTWSAKDTTAEEADERDAANMGADASQMQFLSEDYTGPSWNVFASGWKWIKNKLRGRKK